MSAAKLTYYASFHSHASYGIIFWGASAQADRIFLLQKRAIRALCQLKVSHSCKQHFKEQNIMTIYAVYIFNCIRYILKNINKFPSQDVTHDHQTRQKSNLNIPKHRTKKTQDNVVYWGIKFYNYLPEMIRTLPRKRLENIVKQKLIEATPYNIDAFFGINF